jgi:putative ABC transport system permease protein
MHIVILGFRALGRTPGLAVAAIASIALGIGASTAIFSVARHVVLAPLPFPAPEQLVMFWETAPDNPARWVAPANYLDWQSAMAPHVTSMAAFDSVSLTLTGTGDAERLRGVSASGRFFDTIGQPAAEGRTLRTEDDAPGAPCVAVLSAGLQARRFPGRTAVGQELVLDGRPCTVVGVLPTTFRFPLQPRAELWVNGDRGVPRSFPFEGDVTAVRDAHLLFVVARLRPEVSADAAAARLTTVAARLAAAYPATNAGLGARVMPLHEAVVGDVGRVIWMLQAAVLVLLAVAAANVAHLLIGRAASRGHDLAVRVSLGASRGDLARQMFGEALAYALPGGVLGLLLAAWGVDLLVASAPPALPRVHEIAIDGLVLAATATLTLATTLIVGMAPLLGGALTSSATLQTSGARVTRGGARRWHRGLVVAELALAQVVVVAAWLLVTSLDAATRVPLGYDTTQRVAAELTLARDRYGSGASATAERPPVLRLVSSVLERLERQPGVRGVAAAFTAPLSGAPNRGIRIIGAEEPPDGQEPDADFQAVTPGFFTTLGLRLTAGRLLSATDDHRAAQVVVVNDAFAARHFAGANAVGRVIEFGGRAHEVVGVVGDTRYRRVETAPYPTFYVPLAQSTEAWPFLAFLVWADADPAAIGAALRSAVREADPAQPIASIRPLTAAVDEALAPRRFNTRLVTLFAAATMLLAAIGAYGVSAALAAARARELSIRAALGASGTRLAAQVMGDTALLAGVACVAGLAAAWFVGRGLDGLLFGVTARDPWALLTAAGTVTGAALLAVWPAARRVSRTTPMDALRADG